MALVKPPTPEEFKVKLNAIRFIYFHEKNDMEECHTEMDDYILKVLETLGYEEGVKVFRTTPKWYA